MCVRTADVKGGSHSFPGQPEAVERVADEMAAWMRAP
jgi:hypothetical protein